MSRNRLDHLVTVYNTLIMRNIRFSFPFFKIVNIFAACVVFLIMRLLYNKY